MSKLDETFANDVRAALDSRRQVNAWPLLVVLLALIGAAGVWAYHAEIEEVTTGDGRVIPSSQTQIVQSLEGGLVAEIFVREGDIVDSGQPLVRIDDTGFAATLGELRQKRMAIELRSRRLAAEAAGSDLQVEQGEATEAVRAGERALFAARRSALNRELSVIDQQLAQRRLEKVELETRLGRTRISAGLLQEELERARALGELGAFPQMDLLRLEREAQNADLEVEVLKASVPRAEAAIQEALAQRESAVLGFRAKAHEELTRSLNDLSILDETLKSARDKVRRTTLRAPVRGIINKFSVATIGAVVAPGESIAEIVPVDDTLLIEAKIRPQDVAFLYPNQEASVKVTAYDYTIYGDLAGKVERISPDTITDEEGNTFYRVIVRTDKNHLEADNKSLPIIPGMVVSTSILTGNKTVLEYLIKPIIKAKSEALRER